MRKRWPRVLLAVTIAVVGGTFIAAVISQRRPADGIPGDAPILGLAAVTDGLLVATDEGLYISKDSEDWAFARDFGEGRVFTASATGRAVVRWRDGTGSKVARFTDLSRFEPILDGLDLGTAVARGEGDEVFVITPDGLSRLTRDEAPRSIEVDGEGPRDPISLAFKPPNSLLVGALVDGIWEIDLSSPRWRMVAPTPTKALIVDSSGRFLVGTPGGLLWGNDDGFGFTELRVAVEGIAEADGVFYAVTSDRVVFVSEDGVDDWAPRSTR